MRRSFVGSISDQVLTREMYLECLKIETKQWRDLYREKEKQAKIKPADIVMKEDNLKNLPKEYIEFIDQQPNYFAIIEDTRQFISELQCYHLWEANIILKCQSLMDDQAHQRDDVVAQLLEESKQLCGKCDNGLCTVDIHPMIAKANSSFPVLISEFSSIQLDGNYLKNIVYTYNYIVVEQHGHVVVVKGQGGILP